MEAFSQPQWWSNAVYKHVPGKGLLFAGYSRPALKNFRDHVAAVPSGTWASWVWFGGEWVRVV